MIFVTVLKVSSAPSSINRSCNPPAVSFSPIEILSLSMTLPVSISFSMKNVVTPVSFSPLITAQLIGAAPL